jgi:hypothetical protein
MTMKGILDSPHRDDCLADFIVRTRSKDLRHRGLSTLLPAVRDNCAKMRSPSIGSSQSAFYEEQQTRCEQRQFDDDDKDAL